MRVPRSLAEVRAEARGRVYPTEVLQGLRSGLLLFGAGFYGSADGIWFRDAGLQFASVVDIDSMRLGVMRALYPGSWTFECADVWEWCDRAKDIGAMWDIVSADPPIDIASAAPQELIRCATGLATRYVIVGAMRSAIREFGLEAEQRLSSDGRVWRITEIVERNSDGASWIVMKRI